MPGGVQNTRGKAVGASQKQGMKQEGILRSLLFDPGLGFAVGNILLFASTGGVPGLVISTAAAALITANNIAQRYPRLIKQKSRLGRLVHDPRTPNTITGTGLVAITAAGLITALTGPAGLAAGGGVLAALKAAGPTMWLSSFTGMSFAVANFGIAANLKNKDTAKPADKSRQTRLQKLGHTAKMLLRSPDTYIAAGLMGMGLISGGWSMLAFPAVMSGYVRTIRNSMADKPPHTGHPKIHYAAAGVVFSAVGLLSGNVLPALSNMIATYAVSNVEAKLTPGGFKQIWRDIKGGIAHKLGRGKGAKKSGPKPAEHAPPICMKLPGNDQKLQRGFNRKADKTHTSETQPVRKPTVRRRRPKP